MPSGSGVFSMKLLRVFGTLWHMASESGSPGHVVASLIVLSKFFFFFLNQQERLLLFTSKNRDYRTICLSCLGLL